MRVLLVEDDAVLRDALQGFLADCGLQVQTAGDGVGGLAAALDGGGEIGCVVTDCSMPRMDGLELTRRLRSAFTERPLPVIVMSGDRVEGAAFAAGAALFLQKPFSWERLLGAICSLTGRECSPGPERQGADRVPR